MAHAIVAARDQQDAARSSARSGVKISDAIHRVIWSDPTGRTLPAPFGGDVGTFPFLSRLADAYGDAIIHPAEVASFRREVLRVLEVLVPTSAAASAMQSVLALAHTAEADGRFLFCHGD
jgi:hypothetical protein